jgi:O-antigen/teichoic acid export membrane protein
VSQSQRIFKNVVAGGVCTAAGGLVQSAAVLLIARRLSVSEFGLYSFMATLAFVLYRLSDMGISAILTRDLAVDSSKSHGMLSAALSLAWLVVVTFALLTPGVILLLPGNHRPAILAAIMGLAGLMQFPCGCYGSVLRAREENELDGLGFLLHKTCLLTLVLLTLSAGYSIVGVVFAHLISAFVQCLFYRGIVARRCSRPRWGIYVASWRYLLSNSLPFGLAGSVRLLGEQADVTIIAWLASFAAVGLYGGPYRFTVGLRFIPDAMVIALLPMYSRAALRAKQTNEFQELYERGVRAFLVLALAVVIVLSAAPAMLASGLLGPRYAPSAAALRPLAFVAGIFFMASPFPYLLTALSEQSFLLFSSAIATAVRIVLDVMFTKWLGFTGPCYALMISESLLLFMWIRRLEKAGFSLPIVRLCWRSTLVCLTTLLVLFPIHTHSLRSLIPLELAAAALYLGGTLKLGVFSEADLRCAREGVRFIAPFLRERTSRFGPRAYGATRMTDRSTRSRGESCAPSE